MFIGERLAELRKDKGLIQKELASELGISWKTLSSYERNEFSPSDAVEENIAKFFNVSLDYFHGLIAEEIPISRERYIVLPKDYPEELRLELINHLELLKLKYKVK